MVKTVAVLSLKQTIAVPLEAAALKPAAIRDRTAQEIRDLPILYGSADATVGDFFSVELDVEEGQGEKLILQGDLSRVKRLGQAMEEGELILRGSCGFHAGNYMSGGLLRVEGDAGDWLGAHMTGGIIQVQGDAGHFIGGAHRGRVQGMRGGAIIIQGDAGQMLGTKMRGGLIAVAGHVGDSLGYHMNAGTLLVGGAQGRRIGAGMVRGSLILLSPAQLLPSFYENCTYQPSFWGLLYRWLGKWGFAAPLPQPGSRFTRYSGDMLEGGKGEILLWNK